MGVWHVNENDCILHVGVHLMFVMSELLVALVNTLVNHVWVVQQLRERLFFRAGVFFWDIGVFFFLNYSFKGYWNKLILVKTSSCKRKLKIRCVEKQHAISYYYCVLKKHLTSNYYLSWFTFFAWSSTTWSVPLFFLWFAWKQTGHVVYPEWNARSLHRHQPWQPVHQYNTGL